MQRWMERLEILADLVSLLSILSIAVTMVAENILSCVHDGIMLTCTPTVVHIVVQIFYGVALMFLFGGFLVVLPLFIFSVIQKIRRIISTRSFWMSELWQKSRWILVALILGGALLWIVA